MDSKSGKRNDDVEKRSLTAPARDDQVVNQGDKTATTSKKEEENQTFDDGNDDKSLASVADVSAAPVTLTVGGAKGNPNPTQNATLGVLNPSTNSLPRPPVAHGAVHVAGFGANRSALLPESSMQGIAPIEAHVVNNDEHTEGDILRRRADEIARHVMERLRQDVVDAELVKRDDENSNEASERLLSQQTRFTRIAGCAMLAVLVVIAVIVIAVVETRKSSSPTPPSSLPTAAPAKVTTALPAAAPTATSAAPTNVPDLRSNRHETILELVNTSLDHTLFVRYMKNNDDSTLAAALSSPNNTLFAPTDESFRALQEPPYPYYFDFPANDWWGAQLGLLLNSHVVPLNITASEIFEKAELPTIYSDFTLTVNLNNATIENGASIVIGDIEASNGYIQVPDRVILVENLRYTLFDCVVSLTDAFDFSPDITMFRKLIVGTGLQHLLSQNLINGISLFLPSDTAFAKLDENTTTSLFSFGSFATEIVMYHILNFNTNTFPLPSEYLYFMSNGVSAWLTNNNLTVIEAFQINGVPCYNSLFVKNGFIHVIDQLLIPPDIGDLLEISTKFTENFDFTTFVGIVEGHADLGSLFRGQLNELPNFLEVATSFNRTVTVFAPLESALTNATIVELFNRWLLPDWLLHLQNVVLQHFTLDSLETTLPNQQTLTMLSGFTTSLVVGQVISYYGLPVNPVTIDGIQVSPILGPRFYSGMTATDGSIYAIDDVLLPPWVDLSVYELLVNDSGLSLLASLVRSSPAFTDLLNSTKGPLTLLAPNNTAFDDLLGSSTDASNATFVRDLLSRLIVRGNLYLPSLNSTVATWSNETLQIKIAGNTTIVGGATVLKANELASNGVIHIIDRVLE